MQKAKYKIKRNGKRENETALKMCQEPSVNKGTERNLEGWLTYRCKGPCCI